MTENSIICNFIKSNGTLWKERLKELYPEIIVKEQFPLAIFNYGIGARFYDPLVKEARGIIINQETCEVVCFPFQKFGKFDESYADSIDWTSAKVQEKIDGSIIKLWYNRLTNEWQFSSNSMINAKDAHIHDDTSTSLLDIVILAENYKDIKFDTLDKDLTYIFELTSPYNTVVLHHATSMLHHIGTRNNVTGNEMCVNIGIEKPKEFPLCTLGQCLSAISQICYSMDDSGKISGLVSEGFVVVDKYFHRVKIKSPIYMMLHSMIDCPAKTKETLVELLFNRAINFGDLLSEFPEHEVFLKYYDYKVAELKHDARKIVNFSRLVYEKSGNDRKEVAMRIKDHPLSSIGFASLNNTKSSDEILLEFGYKKMCNLIPTYYQRFNLQNNNRL